MKKPAFTALAACLSASRRPADVRSCQSGNDLLAASAAKVYELESEVLAGVTNLTIFLLCLVANTAYGARPETRWMDAFYEAKPFTHSFNHALMQREWLAAVDAAILFAVRGHGTSSGDKGS